MKDPAITKATQDPGLSSVHTSSSVQLDKVRVRLHLGALDVKDEWRRLEPRLEATLERAGRDISDASRTTLVQVTDAVRHLRQKLR